ncbi:Gp49 family protein [Escherichia albertii]|uniref:Gp49 family protein n=1 Tax=Escherichia albertii TaxID=208962 RepID=UPI001374BE9F|nr:Gp49 family protein [Escherichia albertii]
MNQNKPSMLTGKWNEKQKFRNNWLRRVMFASAFLLILSGCSGSRSANLTPTPTKVNHPAPKSAFMCRMPEFSSEYFDAEIGRKVARKNAIEKIWPLEGYLLKQKLSEQI